MRRLALVIAVLVAVPLTAQAGGGGGEISQCRGFATGTSISMLDSCFDAVAHTAPSNTELTIRNDGFLPHSFTSVDGSFDTGMLEAGETVTLTIEEPGIYEVFCTLHGTAEGSGMAGLLVVGEPDPGTVAASIDKGEIQDAIAVENRVIADAIDRQSQSIGDLRASQAELKAALRSRTVSNDEASAPVVVHLPEQTNDDPGDWMLMGVVSSAGLAAAALLVSLRARRLDNANS